MHSLRSMSALFRPVLVALLVLFPGLMLASTPAHAVPSDVVISQVYGGGGTTYTHDFVELHNRGTTTVNISTWSVQVTTATGASWTVTPLLGSIPAGGYYLVRQGTGAGGGAALPAADAIKDDAPLSATAGKVALVSSVTPLSGATPVDVSQVLDLVGYGAASYFEGSPTAALTASTAALRGDFGCVDTDHNASDFASGVPLPRNSATPGFQCQFTLTVTPVGNGSVGKSPDQSSYVQGTLVDLTATADPGWHFVEWSGDASGNTNPLQVTMDGNKNITATFASNTYTLSVTPVGNGSVGKSPDQPSYTHGSVVDLTATADPGWTFTEWSGDASGSTNPLQVTMDGNKNITATFTINTYTLTVTPVGNGSVGKSPDQPDYDFGTLVDLTATPATGWHFVGWSGDASGDANPLQVTMDGNKNITATFAINTYTLTVTPVGSGSVGKSPDQPDYPHGTLVDLTATADAGWTFTGWSGDASGSTNPLQVTMDGNKNITATFTINTYTLTVTPVGNGSVGKSPDQPDYDFGTLVDLTATPATGWHFVGWSGDATGNTNPLQVTMDANKSITATFAEKKVVVSQVYGGGGESGATYTHDFVELFNGGEYAVDLSGWSVQYASATGSSWTATELSGTIQPHSYLLVQLAAGGGGSTPLPTPDVTGSTDLDGLAGKVALVSSTTPLAVNCPSASDYDDLLGYGTADCAETSPALELTNLIAELRKFGGCIDTDNNSADFIPGAPNPRNSASPTNNCSFTLTVLVDPPGKGTVGVSPNQSAFSPGAPVQLDAIAAAGYHFDRWSGDVPGIGDPHSFNMDGNLTVTAHFVSNAPPAGQLVISQFFGGGGDQQTGRTHDYVELYNRGNGPVDLTGWTVQFASATGEVWNSTPLTGSIPATRYYLVRLFTGGGGDTPLKLPDAIGALDLHPSEGKIALVNSGTVLEGACPGDESIVDLVGYGGANCFETAPAASSSVDEAAFRKVKGCHETNHNQNDFANGAPDERNSADSYVCPNWLAVDPASTRLALSMPLPNPSRGNFNFSIGLPSEGDVRVTVSDVLGRRIATLHQGGMAAGVHSLSWDGVGSAGPIRAGLYYLTLEHRGERAVRRLVIVR